VSGPRRVIVGTNGSPGSLGALRYAESLARLTDATLIPVLAWTPPGGEHADRHSPCPYLRRVWTEDAWQRLWHALDAAWGELPAGLPVRPLVQRGEAGPVLTTIASRPGDLLVVGAGRRGALARIASGRVSRYCLAHAHSPVLAVPPPALAQTVSHGPLGWAFWHRTLTRTASFATAAEPPRSFGLSGPLPDRAYRCWHRHATSLLTHADPDMDSDVNAHCCSRCEPQDTSLPYWNSTTRGMTVHPSTDSIEPASAVRDQLAALNGTSKDGAMAGSNLHLVADVSSADPPAIDLFFVSS
jgi:nucleotide-binding universal stress UspA family protein